MEKKKMSAAEYWIVSVSTDMVFVALFYLWLARGIEQAGAVLIFWLWFFVALRILGGIVLDKTAYADKPRPAGFIWYHVTTELALISTLVWIGYLWLPAMILVGAFMIEGTRNREPKAKGGAA